MAVIDVGPVLAGSDLPVPVMAATGSPPPGVNNAKQIRRNLIASMLAPGAAEQTVRDGVLARLYQSGAAGLTYTGLALVQDATPAQRVLAFPGTAVISRSGQGPYLLMQTTVPQIPLDVADGTNPRYDLVYLRLYDAKLGDPTSLHGFQWCVVKGNPQASPVIPSLPAVDGVQAVGAILRPAGVNTVANSQITDLRKSTAVAGGVRPLLPGDLLTDPGSVHGERRCRATPSGLVTLGAPPVLYDWWDAANSVWRGTQSWEMVPTSYSSASVGPGATGVVASITIPDPGWSYYIGASSCVNCLGAGNQDQFDISTQVRIGSTTVSPTPASDVVTNGLNQISKATGSTVSPAQYGKATGVQSGSKTVNLLVKNGTASNTITLAGSTSLFNALTVRITPA